METTHTLHFMCGKAGAGKSTLAQALAQTHQAALLREDIWLARLYPDELRSLDDYLRYAGRIKTVVGPIVTDLLRQQSVVLDFPANTVETRRWFRALFEQARAAHTLHYVNASDELCLRQIGKRNIERPEGSHALSEAMFRHLSSYFQPPAPAEGFEVREYLRGQGEAGHA